MSCRPDISILSIWPKYPVEIGGGGSTGGSSADEGNTSPRGGSADSSDDDGDLYLRLGHAGILLIKGGTGQTTAMYYEFGRYRGPKPTAQGNVRSYPVHGIVLESDGWPTEENIRPAIEYITRRSGKNTYFHGNVDHKCGGEAYDKGVAFAEAFAADPDENYALMSNSCISFAKKVNKAGGWSWFGPIAYVSVLPGSNTESGLFDNHIIYDPDRNYFNENVWQISGW